MAPLWGLSRNVLEDMRLLLVDSDRDLLKVWEEMLSLQGFEVEVASDSEKALSRIQEREYDVVAGGWQMEPMEALSFFALVRSRMGSLGLLCFGPEELELEEFIKLRELRVGFLSAYRSFGIVADRLRMVAREG